MPPCTGTGCSVEEHYRWGLEQGYSGTWDWSMQGNDGNDDAALCAAGMAALAEEAKVRSVKLGADPPDANDKTCRDVACNLILETYPLKGKMFSLLKDYFIRQQPCIFSCSDVPPNDQFSCAEQASFGKCDQDWMVGFCCKSCFACSPDAIGCEESLLL